MALELRIIGPDGAVRTVVAEPGAPIELAPGETVVLTPETATAVTTAQQGDNLVLQTADGNYTLQGFFQPVAAGTSPSALGYLDATGFNLLTADGTFAPAAFEAITAASFSTPELLPLPETFTEPGSAARATALRSILPGLFEGGDGADGGSSNRGQGGGDDYGDELDSSEIFAGVNSNGDPVIDDGLAFTIGEDAAAGTVLGTVGATDPDGDALTFSITGGNVDNFFTIDPSSGEISVASGAALDFETRASYTLEVTVTDPRGASDTTSVNVTVSDANDAPVITPTNFSIAENSAVSTVVGTVVATDVDSPAAARTYAIVGGTGAGTFAIDPNSGQITVANNALLDREARASLTLTVQANDNGSPNQSTTHTYTVQITGVNEFAPGFTAFGPFNVAENTTAVGSVVASDADAPGDTLTYSIIGSGADDAQFTINASTGAISFLAAPDFEVPGDTGADGTYDVDVRVSDGTFQTDQSIQITVTDANDPPQAADDVAAVNEDGTTGNIAQTILRINDLDQDGDSFTITAVGTGGTVGTVSFTPGAAGAEVVTYTADDNAQDALAAGETTTDTFTYTLTESGGGLTDTATVTVTITGVNDAPTSGTGTTALGTADSSNAVPVPVATSVAALIANASHADVDNGAVGGIAVTSATNAGSWEYSLDSSDGVDGTWSALGAVAAASARVLGATAWVRFTPPADSSTSTETLTYRAWDTTDGSASGDAGVDTTTNGGTTAFSTNTYDGTHAVAPIPDPPVAVDDDAGTDAALSVLEDGTTAELAGAVATGALTQNDSDPDAGDTFRITSVDTTGTVGSVSFNAGTAAFGDETLTYTADGAAQDNLAAGETTTDSFTYTITDFGGLTDTATVTVTITGVNDAPTSGTGTTALGGADSSNAVPVPVATSVAALIANASHADVDNGAVGGVAVTGVDNAGQWEYSLDSSDGVDGTWSALGAVAAASARVLGATAWVRFTPPADSSTSTETLTYRAWDTTDGSASGDAGVDTTTNGGTTAFSTNTYDGTHAVAPIPDPPVAVDDDAGTDAALSVLEDGTTAELAGAVATGALTQNDSDPDAGDTFRITGVDTTGTVGSVSFNPGTGVFGDETLTYTADGAAQDNLAAGETTTDSFTYTITDAGGLTDTATVTVTITGVNDAPTSGTGTTALGGADSSNAVPVPVATSVAALIANASHADVDNGAVGGIAVTSATNAGQWEYSLDSTDGVDGTWSALGAVAAASARVLGATAWVRFTPPADSSTSTETLTYRAWDTTDGSASGDAGVDTTTNGGTTAFSTNTYDGTHAVAPIPDPPVAVDDDAGTDAALSVLEDGTTAELAGAVATGALTQNDSDPDAGDTFRITGVDTTGTVGSVSFNPGTGVFGDETLTYTADGAAQDNLAAGETTTDSFTYTITDFGGLTDTATVTVTITGVNDAPTSGTGTTALGGADSSNAVPVPVATSVAALIANASHADVDNGAVGGVAVTGVDNAGQWEYSLDSTDGVDGTWSALGAVAAGSARVLGATAWVRFTPPADSSTSTETLTYRAWDTTDGSASGDAGVDTTTNGGTTAFSTNTYDGTHAVAPIPDPPVAVDDDAGTDAALSVLEDGTTAELAGAVATGALTQNDSDPDAGDTFRITSVDTTGTVGSVSFNEGVLGTFGDETLTYTADGAAQDNLAAGETTTDSFTYTITDFGGLTDTATVTVTITGVNDAPTSGTGTTALGGADSSNAVPVPVATSVAALIANASHADVDNGAVGGIAVTSATNAGSWEYSLDSSDGVDGTWSALGAVAAASARVLGATAWVRFTPPADSSTSTETLTYRAWDTTDGSASGDAGVDTTTNGGTTAFSTNTYDGTHAVAPIPDPPVAGDDAAAVNEDGTTGNIAQTILRLNDSDPDVGDGFAITAVGTVGTVGTVGFTPGAAGAEVVTYTADDNAQDALAAGETTTDTFTYTLTDTIDGSGTDTATVTVTITGVNDAPTSGTGTTALAGADSSNAVPVPVATSVAALIANASHADVDNGAVGGVAVTGVDNAGQWEYSLDSSDGVDGTWSALGAVAAASARVLGATAWVRFTPPADSSTSTETLTYRAWDTTDGSASGDAGVDTTTNGGTTAFSTNSYSGTHAVAPIPDPPVAVDDDAGTDAALSVLEDGTTAELAGAVATGALTQNDSDPDAGDTFRIVSVDTTGTVGSVSFNEGVLGTFGDETLTYTADGAAQDNLAAGETTTDSFTYTIEDFGGLTDTATVTVTITGVNDAPTSGTGTTALSGADSSNAVPVPVATSVAALIANASHADVDNGAVGGIAVTDADNAGSWEYSLDSSDGVDGTWSALGAVAAASARVLGATAWVRFTPPADSSTSTETLTYRAWDTTDGSASGDAGVDTTTNGGTTAFSTNTYDGTHAVAPVPDPPVAGDDAAAVNEDGTTGNIAQTILRLNDSDPDVGDGFAITAVGTVGTVGTVGFTPGAAGAEVVTYTADDNAQDALAAGETTTDTFTYTLTDTIDGSGTDTATVTVTITGVNDAPTSGTGTTALAGADSSNLVAVPVATSVAALIANASHADVDNGAVGGVAVTGVDNAGQWEYSLDSSDGVDGTWSALGAVAAASARVLGATAWVRFTPPADSSSSTETLTYRAWDTTDGSASGDAGVDTTTNGGTTAFSTNTYDGTHAVAPVFDPPVAVDDDAGTDAALTVAEDGTTINLAGTVATAPLTKNDSDPDAGDTFRITSADTTGTVGSVSFNAGTAAFGDETLTYTADGAAHDLLAAGETTTDTFTYTITDNLGGGTRTDTATVTVTITGVNDAPVHSATANTDTYQEDAAPLLIANADYSASTIEAGETIESVVFRISNLADAANEQLTFDGTTITLDQDLVGGSTAGNGYAWTVSNPGGTAATVTFTLAGQTVGDTETRIKAARYAYSGDDITAGTARVVTVQVQDSGGAPGVDTSTELTLNTITIEPVNDAPTQSATARTDTYQENAVPLVLADADYMLSTVEAGQAIDAVIFRISNLEDAANEELTFDGTTIALSQDLVGGNTTDNGYAWTVSNPGGSTATVTFTLAGQTTGDTESRIEAATYAYNGEDITAGSARVVTVQVQDDGGTSPGVDTSTQLTLNTVTIEPVNDAPTIGGTTAPNPVATESGTGTNQAQLVQTATATVTDDDAANFNGGTLTVSLDAYRAGDVLSVAGGALAGLGTIDGTFDGVGTDLVINLGAGATPANLDSLIEALRYENTGDDPDVGGTDNERAFTITLNDGGNAGSGGPLSSGDLTGTVTVEGENDAPVNTVPSSLGGAVAAPLFINGQVSIDDPDDGGNGMSVTLTASEGTATITVDNSGTAGISNNNTAVVTITGTKAEINNALDSITYNSNVSGAQTITVDTSDLGNTGDDATVQTDSDVITITLSQAPTVTVPAGPLNLSEDTTFDFTNTVSVDDPDDPPTLQVTLTVTNGVLTLASTSGLTFDAGADNSASMTFTGSEANISTALTGLTYLGNANYNGSDTLNVTVNDGGQLANDSVTLNIAAVNDAPQVIGAIPALVDSDVGDGAPGAGSVPANATLVSSLLTNGVNVTDVDGTSTFGIAVTALDASLGTWFFTTDGSNWLAFGTPSEGSARLLFADADTYIYLQPDGTPTGAIADAITFRAWDRSGAGGSPVTEGTTFDVSSNGGTTAFSGGTAATADITINAGGGGATSSIDLTALNGTLGFKINGIDGSPATIADFLGFSVSGGGDYNGDGLADTVIGAWGGEGPGDPLGNRGEGYVIYGNASPLVANTTGFDLATLGVSQGTVIRGDATNDRSGVTIASGADFDGNGQADVILGSFQVFDFPQPVVVSSDGAQSAVDGWNISNIKGGFDVQWMDVGMVDDLDGDGRAELLVGQAQATPNGADSGQAFLILGNSVASIGSLNPLTGSNATVYKFNGPAGSFAGRSVSGLGDIDGDGLADFAIGATGGDNGGGILDIPGAASQGAVYVVLGKSLYDGATFDPSVNLPGSTGAGFNLSSLDGTNGFRASQTLTTFNAGYSISGAGDVNGDGIDDFIIGGPGTNVDNARGIAYVVYGRTTWTSTIDLTNLHQTDAGFQIFGAVDNRIGVSVSGAGDINGDGFDDIIIGGASPDASASTVSYVLFGNTTAALDAQLTDPLGGAIPGFLAFDPGTDGANMNGTNGIVLIGQDNTLAGRSVAGTGDVNGDGFDDIVIGAPTADPSTSTGGANAGQAYIVYGQDFSGAGAADENLSATGGNKILVGDLGDDVLSSNGIVGTVLRGGAGNDVLRVNTNEIRVDGGGGTDILTPDANGIALDFSALSNNRIYTDIEQIQLNGFGNNALTLDPRDVLEMTPLLNELLITGDAGDSVSSSGPGWSAGGTTNRNVFVDDTSSVESLTFNIYNLSGSNVSMLIQDDLSQSISLG